MDEKVIRSAVPIIPAVLLIGCILAAFATHGWDMQATLFAEDPAKTAKSLTEFGSGVPGEGSEFFKFNDVDISGDRVTVKLEIQSPLNMPITVKELSAEIPVGDGVGMVSLPEPVTIPAKGQASLNLEGTTPDAGTISDHHAMENRAVRNMNMVLDISGIELSIKQPEGIGGVS
ncbi:MAG: hypothetical protein C5617_007595 [ANME-2 cluster archaeon]|jgi:hypothetical protein|nr:MAG: hypothetical protein C5617_007595 [ANME-2 cluster archaeon]